jgi:hypothetical protein
MTAAAVQVGEELARLRPNGSRQDALSTTGAA